MNKIEEIYRNNWAAKYEGMDFRYNLAQQNHIYDAMKEYAEYYAQKCLKKLDDEAQYTDQDSRFYDSWVLSDNPSFKFEFPPHD
jgi:hypothetical protein